MMTRSSTATRSRSMRLLSMLAVLLFAGLLTPASAQGGGGDQPSEPPTSYHRLPGDEPEEPDAWYVHLAQAACWYLPNRVADLSDIPRLYVTIGDGLGFSARFTKWLNGSWFENNAFCLGWTKRTPPVWGENIEERYFGFLFARKGEFDRDPTEVGLSAHLLVLGANIALSLGEAVDFAVGFLGIDIAADDHGPFLFGE